MQQARQIILGDNRAVGLNGPQALGKLDHLAIGESAYQGRDFVDRAPLELFGPVVKNADARNLNGIAQETRRLVESAKAGRLKALAV